MKKLFLQYQYFFKKKNQLFYKKIKKAFLFWQKKKETSPAI